jgi:hypothetical protein
MGAYKPYRSLPPLLGSLMVNVCQRTWPLELPKISLLFLRKIEIKKLVVVVPVGSVGKPAPSIGNDLAMGSAGLSKRLWASRRLVQGRCGQLGDGLVRGANSLARRHASPSPSCPQRLSGAALSIGHFANGGVNARTLRGPTS